METRTIDTDFIHPLYGIRWAAVLAGLAVGLGVHLLLLLIGAAVGPAVYGVGERPDGGSIALTAVIWDSISLLSAAVVGGYVAARGSGLRRRADGVLHAVTAWGAAMLCYALLTGSVVVSTLSGVLGTAAVSAGVVTVEPSESSMSELMARLERGDRAGSVRMLRERFGLSSEQAERAVDRALALVGSSAPAANFNDAAQAVSATSTWLSLVIFMSLAGGAGGGLIGAHGSFKRSRPGYRRRQLTQAAPANDYSGHDLPTAG